MISTIIRKFNTLLKLSYVDKNTKRYLNLNKSIFNPNLKSSNQNKGIILIDLFDWNPFVFFWSIFSNLLKKKENLDIKFFYFPLYNRYTEKYFFFKRRLIKVYESFGCSLGVTNLNKNPSYAQKKKYFSLFKNIKSKNDLVKYEYKSVLIGDLIYDTVLRKYRIPTFDLNDKRFKKTFFEAHLIYDLVSDYFNQNNVKYIFVSDVVYNSFGIITRIAGQRDIRVFRLSEHGYTHYRLRSFNPAIRTTRNPYNKYKEIFSNIAIEKKEIALNEGEKILKKRVQGDIFTGIEYVTKSPFSSSSNKNKELFEKNSFQVLLALHNFFDNPHKYRYLYYNDYLEWALKTIDILTENKINTYVKWHPLFYRYSSDHLAKKIITEKVESHENLKMIFNDQISYKDLVENGLNWALTTHGTVANELPYLGVKVMCCGDHPHINYGFSITPESREDYETKLKNIKKIDYKINKNEIYEFYYMHYLHFNQKNYKNTINDHDFVYEKDKRFDDALNNSSEYFVFASNKIKNENIILKTENYINEFLEKDVR